jgi:hypothetical protein
MDERTRRQLLGLLRDRAGPALRSVVSYDPGGSEVLHLREDVSARYSEAQAESLVDAVRGSASGEEVRAAAGMGGDLACTVHVWDDHIGMHFPLAEGTGVLVALDPDAAGELYSFVTECRDALGERSLGD